MAEEDVTDQEETEQPTAKRFKEAHARRRGMWLGLQG
ncbi:MAG: hypothetical protein ACI9W6_001670 [Motiliproteus sp.]|jgi:hypothetical protein